MKGRLRAVNAKIKFSIQNFGQNDKATKNSIYKVWVNNSILNGIALKDKLKSKLTAEKPKN